MVEFKAGDRVRAVDGVHPFYDAGDVGTVEERDPHGFLRVHFDKGEGWWASPLKLELLDPTPTRTAILREAERLINGDRQDQYGPPSESFSRIATVMTQFIRGKLKDGVELEPHDVALFYLAGKGCRAGVSPGHRDTWVDIAGFGALGGEVAPGD